MQDTRETSAGRASARPAALESGGHKNKPVPLSRVIWRWHFWIGLLAGPVLVVASVTGAIYIFKEDLQTVLYPELMVVEVSGDRANLDNIVAAATEAAGPGWRPAVVEMTDEPSASVAVFLSTDDHQHRRVYVDPYRATALGELPEGDVLSVVLAIHRRLFAGTIGRVLVELTTSWTIVLLATGVTLWWPRNWRNVAGILVPRLGGKRYVALRDLHSIAGAFAAIIAAIIAITGLLYSLVWGTLFLSIGFVSGSFDLELNPPGSQPPIASDSPGPRFSIQQVMAIAKNRSLPEARVSIELPRTPEDAYAVKCGYHWGPSVAAGLFVDQYSGVVVKEATISEVPTLAQWTQWNYPLHVGSVMGGFSRVIWLAVCCVLCSLPITGIWMWLTRRKAGQTGFPKHHDRPLPMALWYIVLGTSLLLPLSGASLALAFVSSLAAKRFRQPSVPCTSN
ncbi:MAG: PepSY domain-containing protein [Planctomycetota bacterium]